MKYYCQRRGILDNIYFNSVFHEVSFGGSNYVTNLSALNKLIRVEDVLDGRYHGIASFMNLNVEIDLIIKAAIKQKMIIPTLGNYVTYNYTVNPFMFQTSTRNIIDV